MYCIELTGFVTCGTVYLYESSQVSKFGLRSHRHVKDESDVDGDHRNHVDDVQRVMKELPPVGGEQQSHHHLRDKEKTTQCFCYVSCFQWHVCSVVASPRRWTSSCRRPPAPAWWGPRSASPQSQTPSRGQEERDHMGFSHPSWSFTLNLSVLLLLKQPELVMKSTHHLSLCDIRAPQCDRCNVTEADFLRSFTLRDSGPTF